MALTKCKQCGNEVATNAAACPKCGAPVPKGASKTAKVLLFVFGGLGLCFFGTCTLGVVGAAMKKGGVTSGASSSAAESAQYVELRTLLAEYRDNEVRADSNFKGRYVTVTGTVADVKRDIANSIYVTLTTGGILEIPKVQCFFNEELSKKAATLTRGSKVTVRGRVDGLMMNVLVHECEFM